jgi:hypothetical protein
MSSHATSPRSGLSLKYNLLIWESAGAGQAGSARVLARGSRYNIWDALLLPSSSGNPAAPSSSPPLLIPSSSSSSGEFNSFSFVGAVLSGGVAGAGGPAAGTTVFRLLKDDCRCLGSITGGKFCLKMCDGKQACNVPTHATRKAKLQVDHYYIRENDTKAYCDPRLNMTLLTESQASQLRDLQLTKEQWIEFFKSVESGDSSNWFPDVIESSSTHETGKASPWVELMSPKAAEQKTGIFGFFLGSVL